MSHYGLRKAAEYSGLKPAMVDYLCRRQVVVPSGGRPQPGRGKPRRYTFSDIVYLRVVRGLLEQGISVAKLRESLRFVVENYPEITESEVPARFLVTDGRKVYLNDRESGLLADIRAGGQGSFAFVLQLDVVRDEALKAMRASA